MEIIKVTPAIMMIMDMGNQTKYILRLSLAFCVVLLVVLCPGFSKAVHARDVSSYAVNEYGGDADSGETGSGDSNSGDGGSTSTSGYSSEQIAAAKAWLSAHGYAPTRAGAAAAYQDYLAGKLDNDPDVRRYKGLDSDSTNSADSTTDNSVNVNESNSAEMNETNVSGDSNAEKISDETGASNESGSSDKANVSGKSNVSTGEADMTEFLEIVADGEDAEALADTEGSKKYDPFGAKIYALKDKLEITSNDSSVYLLENATEEEYKKSSDQKAFVVIILAIFIVLISGIILIINRGKQNSEL